LIQIQANREQAQRRVNVLQGAFRDYVEGGASAAASSDAPDYRSAADSGQGESQLESALQISSSFLDRLVDLSRSTNDFWYRKELSAQTIRESDTLANLDRMAAYYEDLIAGLDGSNRAWRRLPTDERASVGRTFEEGAQEIFDDLVASIHQVEAIYETLSSRNLAPKGSLYTVTTPLSVETDRALRRSTVYAGAVAFLTATFLFVSLVQVPRRRRQ
jgi:hypothetical protein